MEKKKVPIYNDPQNVWGSADWINKSDIQLYGQMNKIGRIKLDE